MQVNLLFIYLNFIFEKRLNSFSIDKCIDERGNTNIYIPLNAEEYKPFQHFQYGEISIQEPSLICLPELSKKHKFSDIYFSCKLISRTDTLKVHLYQNQQGESFEIYIKNLNHPERVFVLSLQELKILNDFAKKYTNQIRHEFNNFLKDTNRHYKKLLLEYRQMILNENQNLELNILIVGKIIADLQILNLFNPENYLVFLKNFNGIYVQNKKLLEEQDANDAEIELEEPLITSKEYVNFKLLKTIRQHCYHLEKLLHQQIFKLTLANKKNRDTYSEFKKQVIESIQIYQEIESLKAQLDIEVMGAYAKQRYHFCETQIEELLNLLKENCCVYFNSMVSHHDYTELHLIEPYLIQPSGMYIRKIIDNQHCHILPALIEKFRISLIEDILDITPRGIIEYVIQEKKLIIFAELVQYFSIDYTFPLSNRRQLGMILDKINHEIGWKLLENHEKRILAMSPNPALIMSTQANIHARNTSIFQNSFKDARSFVNRIMPGILPELSEHMLSVNYEYNRAVYRIKEIDRELKKCLQFSLEKMIALVEEKNDLLLRVKVCSAVSRKYPDIGFKKGYVYSMFSTNVNLDSSSNIQTEIKEDFKLAKEYLNRHYLFLPGNSYHVLVLFFLEKVIKHYLHNTNLQNTQEDLEILDFARIIPN